MPVRRWTTGSANRPGSLRSSAPSASCCSVEPSVLVRATVYDPRCWATRSASTVRVVSPELDRAITATARRRDARGSTRTPGSASVRTAPRASPRALAGRDHDGQRIAGSHEERALDVPIHDLLRDPDECACVGVPGRPDRIRLGHHLAVRRSHAPPSLGVQGIVGRQLQNSRVFGRRNPLEHGALALVEEVRAVYRAPIHNCPPPRKWVSRPPTSSGEFHGRRPVVFHAALVAA